MQVVHRPGFPAHRAHVAIFNVTAMHVAVVPILPTLVGSGCVPGRLLVASAESAAALTFAIVFDSTVVGHALVLHDGVDVPWGLLAVSHAELLDICQLALHCSQAGCLAFDGFLRGRIRGTKVH